MWEAARAPARAARRPRPGPGRAAAFCSRLVSCPDQRVTPTGHPDPSSSSPTLHQDSFVRPDWSSAQQSTGPPPPLGSAAWPHTPPSHHLDLVQVLVLGLGETLQQILVLLVVCSRLLEGNSRRVNRLGLPAATGSGAAGPRAAP
ncbi:unnamed protein product [Chrysodeixis includens]|uniref:Uncharacterized protein n=1 Tax=Chrysodeixis includens TaxID=689277 RepID=A0A9N8KYH3_CHRIL|nr:unnamed protein product [Chrysodeixis includens]